MMPIYSSEISGSGEGGVVRRGFTGKGVFEQSFEGGVPLLQADEEQGMLGAGTAKAKAWGLRGVGVPNTSGPSLWLKHIEGCVGGGKSGKMGAPA